MNRGTVKKFDDQKGYGFIRAEGVPEDIFVHYSAIKAAHGTFRTLMPGDVVEFRLKRDQKGMKAIDVTRVESAHAY